MRNAANPIRKAFKAVLDLVGVPVYESGGDPGVTTGQIIIAESFRNDRTNKSTWVGEWRQNIEVVKETTGAPGRTDIDDIGEDVLQALMTSVGTTGLVIDTTFQLLNLRLQNQNYLTEQSGTTYINRLIMTLSFIIVQK